MRTDGDKTYYDSDEEYYKHQAMRAHAGEFGTPRPWIKEDVEIFNKFYDQYCPVPKKYAFLIDAGCRDGWTMDHLEDYGFHKPHMLGIDCSIDAVNHAKSKGRNVIFGDMDKLEELDVFKELYYDVIFSRHALEHCRIPDNFIASSMDLLKIGGILFIVVPIQPKPMDAEYLKKYNHAYRFKNVLSLKTLCSSVEDFHNKMQILYYGSRKGMEEEITMVAKKLYV